MDDATGLAEALLGLDGFRVLDVNETPAEVLVTVETTVDLVGCATCGVRAQAGDALGQHPGSAVFRPSGAAGVDEAPVALRRF